MVNHVKNLGDYQKVVMDLYQAGGSRERLYKSIGSKAVSNATPTLALRGVIATVIVLGPFAVKGACDMYVELKPKVCQTFENVKQKVLSDKSDQEENPNKNETSDNI